VPKLGQKIIMLSGSWKIERNLLGFKTERDFNSCINGRLTGIRVKARKPIGRQFTITQAMEAWTRTGLSKYFCRKPDSKHFRFASAKFCHYDTNEATYNAYTNGYDYVPIKLY
jgi:hypothetical protein